MKVGCDCPACCQARAQWRQIWSEARTGKLWPPAEPPASMRRSTRTLYMLLWLAIVVAFFAVCISPAGGR